MKKLLTVTCLAGLLSIPSVVFAEASWYGSIRAGVQSSGGNTSGFDGLSRFGVMGSNEISEGLSAVYQFEHNLNATNASLGGGGRLSYVGLSGGFGTITAGQLWSATSNIVGFTDKSNFFGSNGASGRHGNAVSYAMSSGAMSMQMDAIFNGAATHPSNVDQLEFGVSMNIGEIGKIAFAHRKIEDSEKAISVTYNTGLNVLLEKTPTAVVTGVTSAPKTVVTGVTSAPKTVMIGVSTNPITVVTGVGNKLKTGWIVTPTATLTCTPAVDSPGDCVKNEKGVVTHATSATATFKYLAKDSSISLSGTLAKDESVGSNKDVSDKPLMAGSGKKADGTADEDSPYLWTIGEVAKANSVKRPGDKLLKSVTEYRFVKPVKVTVLDIVNNKEDEKSVSIKVEKTYDDDSSKTEFYATTAEGAGKATDLKPAGLLEPINLPALAFSDVIYLPGDLPDQGTPIEADPTTGTAVGSVTPTTGTVVGSVTPTTGTAVGSVTPTTGTALSDVDGSKSTATTTIGTTPETMGVTNMMKVHGSTTNYIAGQFSYGGVTGHLGFSAQKINDGSKSDATYAGVSGAIGDTGMSYVVQMVRQKQADNNPWVVAVNKSLGGGATLIFEHSNPDSAVNSTSAVALQVGF